MKSKSKFAAFSLAGVLVIVGIITAVSFTRPVEAASQPLYGCGGPGGGYGGGPGSGYGGGYGMMGGQRYGGNYGALVIKDKKSAESDMSASLKNATIDKTTNTITYNGNNVKIVMLGGPEYADGKFVIGGLVNPVVRIQQGATVTMEMINEDEGMPHGVEITSAIPPYDYMPMMQGYVYPGAFIHPMPAATSGHYPSVQVSFTANQTGTYYYICQYPGHAEKGMYGKIIIQ
jgi:rusticyanin